MDLPHQHGQSLCLQFVLPTISPAQRFSSAGFSPTVSANVVVVPTVRAVKHKRPSLSLQGIIMQEEEPEFPRLYKACSKAFLETLVKGIVVAGLNPFFLSNILWKMLLFILGRGNVNFKNSWIIFKSLFLKKNWKKNWFDLGEKEKKGWLNDVFCGKKFPFSVIPSYNTSER